jgi:hypothetical protein
LSLRKIFPEKLTIWVSCPDFLAKQAQTRKVGSLVEIQFPIPLQTGNSPIQWDDDVRIGQTEDEGMVLWVGELASLANKFEGFLHVHAS